MHLRALCLLSLLCLACPASSPERAEDAPLTERTPATQGTPPAAKADDGSLKAGTYTNTHPIMMVGEGDDWVEEQVDDCIWLEPGADGALSFSFILVQANAHTCSMEGNAAPRGPGLWSFVSEEEGMEPCELKIKVTDKAIILEDVEDKCRQSWCGARASIGGADFARQTRKSGNTCTMGD